MKELCKNYKPEILTCPKCGSKLVYKYAVSNKNVNFSSGKVFKIRNLGYGCKCCNDSNVYVSQTANKLSFRGSSYSAKIWCMIYHFKKKKCGREQICDYFSNKGVEISNRNVDIIYKKMEKLFNVCYNNILKNAFNNMLNEFNEIRLSIDLITFCNCYYVIIYDYFSCDLLVIKEFSNFDEIKDFLNVCLSDVDISVVATVRKGSNFYQLLKSVCSVNTKFISYQKF